MRNDGAYNVLGVKVHAVDYAYTVERIIDAAVAREPLSVSALAVHGVMTGVLDGEHRWRLNHFDVVTPDGQPVRWALRLLHKVRLPDRVYGPDLMRLTLAAAEQKGLAVFLFGGDDEIIDALSAKIAERYPALLTVGEASSFRTLSADEQEALAHRLATSGADVVFVGLGCPRQEVFVSEMVADVGLPMLAVGAAFEYIADMKTEPPAWIQKNGLQWLHRLALNPKRLWHRYLVLNPAFVARATAQKLGLWKPDTDNAPPPAQPTRFG